MRVRVDDIFRAIGSFAVKFRWVILILWVAAAVVIPRELPSLASATQGNNSAFLPASAPSEQALELAAPLGTSSKLTPVPVVAARASGPLTPADQAWIVGPLSADLAKVATVVRVRELGQSTQSPGVTGQADQVQVLSDVTGGGNSNATENLIDGLRKAITSASPPAGLQVHLTGDLAIQVDQQKQSGNTGNSVEIVSVVMILIILLLILTG